MKQMFSSHPATIISVQKALLYTDDGSWIATEKFVRAILYTDDSSLIATETFVSHCSTSEAKKKKMIQPGHTVLL